MFLTKISKMIIYSFLGERAFKGFDLEAVSHSVMSVNYYFMHISQGLLGIVFFDIIRFCHSESNSTSSIIVFLLGDVVITYFGIRCSWWFLVRN